LSVAQVAKLRKEKGQAEAEKQQAVQAKRAAEKRQAEAEAAASLNLSAAQLHFDPSAPLLGSGSSADTRRGTYRFPGQAGPTDVALKLFREKAVSAELRKQILQEIRVGSRLDHANLVQMFGTVEVTPTLASARTRTHAHTDMHARAACTHAPHARTRARTHTHAHAHPRAHARVRARVRTHRSVVMHWC
jgi:hypothetical protein